MFFTNAFFPPERLADEADDDTMARKTSTVNISCGPGSDDDSSSIDTSTSLRVLEVELHKDGFIFADNGNIMWAKETHNKNHPRNWTMQRKIYDTIVLLMFEFCTTLISNTGSLSGVHASTQLKVSPKVGVFAFTSTYLLCQAIGSVFLSPYTECYGRKRTYIASIILYTIATACVPISGTLAGVIVCRCISGLLSSVPTVVIGGAFEEIWDTKARIWVINLWVFGAIIAISTAPAFIMAFVESTVGWQWAYYTTAIMCVMNGIGICFVRESRPSQILKDYVKQINARQVYSILEPESEDLMPSFQEFLKKGLKKPVVLFLTEPFLILTTIMSASVYAFAYLLAEALPIVYADFGFTQLQSAHVYVVLIIGAALSFLVRLFDTKFCAKQKDLRPEHKLAGFFIAAPLQALAFWIFAWTIPPFGRAITPLISVLSLIPFGFAINEFDYCLMGYIIDTYGDAAGSASAPLGFFRASLSAVFPLIGLDMFVQLNNNVATSIIAAIATVYFIIAIIFGMYGRRIREASRWVRRAKQKSAKCHGGLELLSHQAARVS